MKTPWNDLSRTRETDGLIDVIGYLNDTLDELLSLAKHLAPAIERIAYPDRYLVSDAEGIRATHPVGHLRMTPEVEEAMKRDADSIRMQRERIEEARRQDGERYWLVKTGGSTLNQTQLDVTELMTHTKLAGEAPHHHQENPYQAIAWASGWEALRCALLGIGQR